MSDEELLKLVEGYDSNNYIQYFSDSDEEYNEVYCETPPSKVVAQGTSSACSAIQEEVEVLEATGMDFPNNVDILSSTNGHR